MLSAMIRLHWKSSRAWVLAAIAAVVALPIVSVALAWPHDSADVASFLARLDAWSLFYPAVAGVLGAVMAGLTWRSDRRGGFVYALTLPIERWRYVWYRFASGAILITSVAAALWLAALLTVATTPRAAFLHAYPTALAAKFGLATLAVFSASFALVALPGRVRQVGARAILALIALQALVFLLGWQGNWLVPVLEALTDRFGPLGILGGRWMLIDV